MNSKLQNATIPAEPPINERVLPVIILGDMVIMPRVRLETLNFPKGRNYQAIQAALKGDSELLAVFVSEAEIANFKGRDPQPLPAVGVLARLAEVIPQPDGSLRVVLDVTTRATVSTRLQHDPFYWARCVPHPDPEVTSAEARALMVVVKAQVEAIVRTMPDLTPATVEEVITLVNQFEQPGQLADFITYSPTFPFEDRITILDTLDPVERLRKMQRKLDV
jgi:ATP-dependent Lon protease